MAKDVLIGKRLDRSSIDFGGAVGRDLVGLDIGEVSIKEDPYLLDFVGWQFLDFLNEHFRVHANSVTLGKTETSFLASGIRIRLICL
jgi:hypothetical protein